MHFTTIALLVAAAATQHGAIVAAQLCPGGNNLFYQGGSGALYQVKCDVEFWTQTNLASSAVSDPVACGGYVFFFFFSFFLSFLFFSFSVFS